MGAVPGMRDKLIFDLPWVIGCISCIYIALTVVVIVELFKIKNPVLIF